MGDVIYLHDRLAEQDRHSGSNTGEAPAAASAGGSEAIQVADLRTRRAGSALRRTITRHLPPSPVGSQSTAFFFELSSPLSYLAAERVERMLGEVTWVPVMPLDRRPDAGRDPDPSMVGAAEREAAILRLPLVIPDGYPRTVRNATRAAAYAVANGSGSRFALAAFRLAFCGGFDLDHPGALAEAAAAAGLQRDHIMRAAADPRWDIQPTGTARGLAGHGVLSMPAIRVASRWFEGIDAVGEASLYTTFRGAHGAAGV
jgi:2-hydroxychromene-2-carboxylate isomerase